MFSKILLKLIDQAIIPAVLVVGTRLASIALFSNYFDIDYTINKQGITFSNISNYVIINSYSFLCIVAIITAGVFGVLINSALFHHEHIKPHTTAKLFALKLSGLIKNSYEVYTKAAVWITYMWLLTISGGIMFYYDMIYPIVFYTSVIFAVTSTVVLILDIETKVNVSNTSDFIFDMDRKFLENKK